MRGTKSEQARVYFMGFEAGREFERALGNKPQHNPFEDEVPTEKPKRKRRSKKYKWSYHQRKKLSAKLKAVHDKKKALGLAWKGNHLKDQAI